MKWSTLNIFSYRLCLWKIWAIAFASRSQGVRSKKKNNTSLLEEKEGAGWASLLCVVLPWPITDLLFNLMVLLWWGCPGQVAHLEKCCSHSCCVGSPWALPSSFCDVLACAVFLLPPPDCERYLRYFKGITGISWLKALECLCSASTFCSYAGRRVVCVHNKFSTLGACQTPRTHCAAYASFMSVWKIWDR